MCTAAAPPRQLALPVTSTTITPDQLSDDSRMLMDNLNIKEVHTHTTQQTLEENKNLELSPLNFVVIVNFLIITVQFLSAAATV